MNNAIQNIIARFTILDAVDITLVAVLIYYVLKLASRTRAMQVLKGLGIILLVAAISERIGLLAFAWVFNYVMSIGAILMVVIFQSELRMVFEHIGRRSRLIDNNRKQLDEENVITQLIISLTTLSKQKIGALIVLERQVALGDIIETGTAISAELSSSLIGTIFMPGTPLHDGAVVVRNGVIEAAGCFLPLTNNDTLPQTTGTRHRAALGLSEVSDSLIFVVSEESGIISCAHQGKLHTNLDAMGIRRIISESGETHSAKGLVELFKRGRREE